MECKYLKAKINDIPWMPIPEHLKGIRKVMENQLTSLAIEQCELIKAGKKTYLGISVTSMMGIED